MPFQDTRFIPRILLVDDSRTTLMLLSTILSSQAEIIVSMDGLTAVNLAREKQPDLIVLDIEMPGICGFDTCKMLKQDPLTRDITVIFITKYKNPAEEIEALKSGAVDFITKPFNATVVKTRVNIQLTLKRQADMLRQQVNLDGLTEVYNRRALNSDLDNEIRRHARTNQPLGLALLDVDHFKLYNDFYGHLEGDQCLKRLANTLKSTTRRAAERVYRYGGEEFAVVLPNTNEAEIRKYGDFLCLKVRQQQWAHNMSPDTGNIVTVSIGVVSLTPSNETAEIMLNMVDKALYQAKKTGRNQMKYWQDT
ncbi:MAG: GGDEF domain-containing response regulator [Plesiomonas sp.]|uniref:GGDEF domain-containing response regulator n=1 Tax=Plesiomonas sp. TaxID=2486279 RepID=UPI003EE54691